MVVKKRLTAVQNRVLKVLSGGGSLKKDASGVPVLRYYNGARVMDLRQNTLATMIEQGLLVPAGLGWLSTKIPSKDLKPDGTLTPKAAEARKDAHDDDDENDEEEVGKEPLVLEAINEVTFEDMTRVLKFADQYFVNTDGDYTPLENLQITMLAVLRLQGEKPVVV